MQGQIEIVGRQRIVEVQFAIEIERDVRVGRDDGAGVLLVLEFPVQDDVVVRVSVVFEQRNLRLRFHPQRAAELSCHVGFQRDAVEFRDAEQRADPEIVRIQRPVETGRALRGLKRLDIQFQVGASQFALQPAVGCEVAE